LTVKVDNYTHVLLRRIGAMNQRRIQIRSVILGLAGAALLALAGQSFAAEVEVKMVNSGQMGAMTFDPPLVQIQPGDSVHFVPTNPGHNAQTIDGMLPDGAEPFKGAIGKELTVQFNTEGVYGYKCLPHFAMGMVGVIVVGKPTNLDAVKAVKTPPAADKRLQTPFAEIK